jgi:prepilin-type N-terminal cleavage/methylation domain-containing protein
MQKKSLGFTLIELVVVITILGILAAAVAPRFIDVTDEAQAAATQGIAGALASGSVINNAVDVLVEAGASTDTFITVDNCNDGASLLVAGIPAGYTVAAQAIADKVAVTCTLTHTASSDTASFVLIGAAL